MNRPEHSFQEEDVNFITPELQFDFGLEDAPTDYVTSDYITERKFITDINYTPSNDLFLLHYNIRSLNKNFDQLNTFINQLKPNRSVIGLSETWLNDTPFLPFLHE